MIANRHISELFENHDTVFSVEFFPPKSEESALQMLRAANALDRYFRPDFVSITYGAGGSTRARTQKYADFLKEEYDWQVMPHLTSVGSSKDEIAEIVQGYKDAGFRNIMALRGDPPKGETDFKPHPDGLAYGSEVVSFIHEQFPGTFCCGVGGYPEKHPQAPSFEEDLKWLKHKVDCGAAFITTQMFFDNEMYYRFLDMCQKAGITVPVLPGLLPVTSIKPGQTEFFGATLPPALCEQLEAARNEEDGMLEVGAEWCYAQMKDLIDNDVPGIHLYLLNKKRSALIIAEHLRRDFPHLAEHRGPAPSDGHAPLPATGGAAAPA